MRRNTTFLRELIFSSFASVFHMMIKSEKISPRTKVSLHKIMRFLNCRYPPTVSKKKLKVSNKALTEYYYSYLRL